MYLVPIITSIIPWDALHGHGTILEVQLWNFQPKEDLIENSHKLKFYFMSKFEINNLRYEDTSKNSIEKGQTI
jgi:hypothetical protein